MAREGGRVDQMKKSRAGRWGNIHAVAKVKMSIIKQPVREGGMSEQGGAVLHSCESFVDKGVRGRG